ncbi:MAG: Uma2 family endonuclease [Dehalococcoidia bacterium]
MTILQHRLTLEDFMNLTEKKPALEFEEGMVQQKVSPRGKHSALQLGFCERLNEFARPRRLGLALPELRSTYAGRSYVPDVSLYRWDRIPRDASGKIANDFFEPPDIAIEIVSPRQSVTALVRRCLWYVANGVQVALLVDPADESILRFRPNEMPLALRGTSLLDLHPLLPGFELTAQQLFDSLRLP